MSEPTKPPAAGADADILVDEVEARQGKRRREIQYHTRQVPALRLLGMVFLSVVAFAHGIYLAGDVPLVRYAWFAATATVYSLVSWWLLLRFFSRCSAVNLGTVFLLLDILWFAGAIRVSGGDWSWLVLLLLVRVADQTNTNHRRVLLFLHLSVASYGLVLLAQHLLDHRPPSLQVEGAKLAIVYITGLYVAATARTATALRNRTSRAIHVARRLILELRSQSEALEKARLEAELAGRAKTAFLANVGHELRTPLTAVVGLTDLVLDTELTAEQREHLAAVHRSGSELVRMVNDFLDLARLESGGLKLKDEPLDLRRLLEEAAAGVHAAATAKGLAISTSVSADVPRLRGDPGRLAQILSHLARNAVKFTARGQVTLSATAARAGSGLTVELAVADTGIGIASDMQAMIFDAFTQVEASTQRKHGGAGLGLALVSRLVKLMNGQFRVESEPGNGARFFVALPLVVEDITDDSPEPEIAGVRSLRSRPG